MNEVCDLIVPSGALNPCSASGALGARLAKVGTVLEREMYTEAAAARLLRVAPGTLHYWLEGGQRGDKVYQPVIRGTATGSRHRDLG